MLVAKALIILSGLFSELVLAQRAGKNNVIDPTVDPTETIVTEPPVLIATQPDLVPVEPPRRTTTVAQVVPVVTRPLVTTIVARTTIQAVVTTLAPKTATPAPPPPPPPPPPAPSQPSPTPSFPSLPANSSQKSSTPILYILFAIIGVVVVSMLGIYIFRQTALKKSDGFKKRLDPNYVSPANVKAAHERKADAVELENVIDRSSGVPSETEAETPDQYGGQGYQDANYSNVSYNQYNAAHYDQNAQYYGNPTPDYQTPPTAQYYNGQYYSQEAHSATSSDPSM